MNIEDTFDVLPVKYNMNPGVDYHDKKQVLQDLEEALIRDKGRLESHIPDPVFVRHFAEMLAEYQKMKYGFIDAKVQEFLGEV